MKNIYKNMVRSWFDRIASQKDLTGFITEFLKVQQKYRIISNRELGGSHG